MARVTSKKAKTASVIVKMKICTLKTLKFRIYKTLEQAYKNKEDVEISTEGSLAKEPSSEDDNSLSKVRNKQIYVINNSTNEWLGLQIPVVRSSGRFALPFF